MEIEVNTFYKYALEYIEKAVPDEEIRKIDMTELFWKEIEKEIESEELVSININAKVRMSKSTTALRIGQEIYGMIAKKYGRDDKFGMKNIARDQQEYSKIMRDPNTCFTLIVTDEMNDLELTGENVSIERAMNNVFSDVHAGRYVHRICCSPKEVGDNNADVFLEIVAVDKKRKITHANLFYKLYKGGGEIVQLIGHIEIYVGDLIKEWEKIKTIFLKKERTAEEQRKIDNAMKRDFYVEYMVKKYEKMEMITKEGILRPRELEYAGVVLKVVEELRSLAKLGVLNKETIQSYVKKCCREEKVPTSIIGEELMSRRAIGILSLWKTYFGILGRMEGLRRKEGKEESGSAEQIKCFEQQKALKKASEDLIKVIMAQEEELQLYKNIENKYNEHITKEEK